MAATPLIFTGLAVSLAFRAGMFNIGAEGQLFIGGIVAGYVGFAWNLPVVDPPAARDPGGVRRRRGCGASCRAS